MSSSPATRAPATRAPATRAPATRAPRPAPRGPSLGLRFFLASSLLVAVAVGVAVAVTLVVGDRIADQAVRRTLGRAATLQVTVEEAHLDRLWTSAMGLASDPSFAGYVSESIGSGDVLSLADQVSERLREIDADLAMVVDGAGVLLVDSLDPSRQGADLSAEPLVAQALGELGAAGLRAREGRLYATVAVPIDTAGIVQGYLVLGDALDDVTALALRRASETEVAIVNGEGAVLGTTLAEGPLTDLRAALAATPESLAPGAAPLDLRLAREWWTADVRPLSDVAGDPLGAIVNLASLAEQRRPFRRISTVLLAVGLLAVAGAFVVSYLLARQVVAPVRELAAAAQAAAEGDYEREIRGGASGEVGQLAAAFAKLLSELREKRDMEAYITQLGRTLPVQDESAVSAVAAPERRDAALLAVELRNGDDAPAGPPPSDPQEALSQLTREMGLASGAVGRHGGKVESVLGHRLVASFQGRARAERALAAAAEVLLGAGNGQRPFSLALASGPVVTGSVTWQDDPSYAVTGEPVDELEALLRVGRPGTLLLSERVYVEVRPHFAGAGVEARAHRSSVSATPLYSVDREVVARLELPEIAATQAMTAPTAPMAATTLSGLGPGSVLGGRFEILSVLGAGGMGVVYKARDRSLGELVAVKMLKEQMVRGEHLEQLKDELRVARRITHPNVLRTYDFGEMNGVPFISMEYVRGITLRRLLDQSGRLPLSAGLRIARQLCRGLAAAHEQGVLHRDIKPENLIIEQSGNAKLMDFGIARRLHGAMRTSQTDGGALVGTPFYLAPEQIEGKEPDERADLYACGMVLYEVFTGGLPYPARGSLVQVVQAKLQERPRPPREHWATMPDPLETLILRCLERDREDRYPDVATLLAELETIRA